MWSASPVPSLNEAESDRSEHELDNGDEIETQIVQVQKGVQQFRRELKALRTKNKKLARELQSSIFAVSQEPKAGGKSRLTQGNPALIARVRKLENEVKQLQKVREEDKEKIRLLRMKEIQVEAADLKGGAGVAVKGDPVHRMRKLLRKFNDLMLVTPLADDGEDCPICQEAMQLKKCLSLACQHIICEICLPKIMKGADETVGCPQCRQRCPRNELELVHYTSTKQWNALLKVAKAWAVFDQRRAEETSEEEAEEEFINDGHTLTSGEFHSSDGVSREQEADRDLETSLFIATTGVERASYSQSPAKEKRRRLEQLVQDRAQKRKQ